MFGVFLLAISAVVHAATVGENRPWTVLLYMNGDNNLDGYVRNLLRRVERGTVGSGAHVVIQFDGERAGDSRRLSLVRSGDGKLRTEVLQRAEFDMGSTQTLADFVEWGIRTFPSERVALAMVGHGRGILNIPANDGSFGSAAKTGPLTLASSSDDTSRSFMNEEEMVVKLRAVLEKSRGGRKLDLFVYDSCLMGNLEVLNALSDIAEYAMASEYTICVDVDDTLRSDRGVGVSVETLVKEASRSAKGPVIDSPALGRRLLESFREDYRDMGSWNDANESVDYCKSTLSLFDLSRVPLLVRSWKELTAELSPSSYEGLFVKMLAEPQIDTLGYTDLGVLSQRLFEITHNPRARDIAAQLYRDGEVIVDRAILHLDGQTPPAGVSIFFPSVIARDEQVNPFIGFYSEVRFAQQTGWGKALKKFRSQVHEERLPIMGRLVEEVLRGRIPQVRPSEDPAYNEHMIYLMTEIAFDDAKREGRTVQLRNYLDLIRSAKAVSEEFLQHRSRVERMGS